MWMLKRIHFAWFRLLYTLLNCAFHLLLIPPCVWVNSCFMTLPMCVRQKLCIMETIERGCAPIQRTVVGWALLRFGSTDLCCLTGLQRVGSALVDHASGRVSGGYSLCSEDTLTTTNILTAAAVPSRAKEAASVGKKSGGFHCSSRKTKAAVANPWRSGRHRHEVPLWVVRECAGRSRWEGRAGGRRPRL